MFDVQYARFVVPVLIGLLGLVFYGVIFTAAVKYLRSSKRGGEGQQPKGEAPAQRRGNP
jgi:hypothetical protein